MLDTDQGVQPETWADATGRKSSNEPRKIKAVYKSGQLVRCIDRVNQRIFRLLGGTRGPRALNFVTLSVKLATDVHIM